MSTLVIIGGGPAGLEAARQARRAGFEVTLVSGTPAGGRATMGSLLPSKVWLHAAAGHGGSDASAIVSHIHATRSQWIAHNTADMETAGVEFVQGRAVLTGPHTVDIYADDQADPARTIEAGAIIIATGSEPTFAPDVHPNGQRIIAPRHTQQLTEIPPHIVFVGGGVTTTEYASAFAALGSRVEVCTRGNRLLARGEADVAEAITRHLETERGVQVHRNTTVSRVRQEGDTVLTTTADGKTLESTHAFIATGRAADLSCIHAGPADLASRFARRPDGGLVTDANCMTSVADVYAIGDAAGGSCTVAKAVFEARTAVQALQGGHADEADAPDILEAVYSSPEVAWVGPFDSLPDTDTEEYRIVRRQYSALLASHIHGSTEGFAKIWVRRHDGVVVAGSVFGEQAATVGTFIQLACNTGLTIDQLSAIPGGHPTIVELLSV